ncbi:von Willebrand factor type A domain protein [uncultured archaeon]|nr:von Willebrand factor type A domain protein [uncultured archaeon]
MDFPQLANPLVLLLISPVVLAGWYAIRKGIPRALIISRIVILSLLIIALASPYTLGTSTIRDEAPKITVVSDQTLSMDLFNKDTGQKIFEALKSKTPTTFKQFAGIKSPIGDEVIQDAEGNNNIVLVSDGNSNYGKDLFEAISFVSKTGTKVFAVRQEPIHNDASVEIVSAKNLIIGNENTFNIVVRQAGNETSYKLDVDIDGTSVESESFTQTERTKVIPVSYTFNSLGTHKVTATITPTSEDYNPLNNVFYKSVFVVPKPQVLMVTDDKTSPLYTVASSLYQVTALNNVSDDLSPYKAVIIDNKDAGQLNADSLRKYVGGGGGLVVVGGDASYDKGNYNNSPVEALLPIISRAAEYRGGKNIVILIDASGSTSAKDATTGISLIGQIDANAQSVVKYIDRGSSIGIVAFGGKIEQTDIISMASDASRNDYIQWISKIGPTGIANPTNIDDGLAAALEMLDKAGGTKTIIVISDGTQISEDSTTVNKLIQQNVDILFLQVSTTFLTPQMKQDAILPGGKPTGYQELASVFGKSVQVLNPDERICTINMCLSENPSPEITPTPTPTPEISHEYPLVAVDTSHFITQYLNLTASVTGYNDVTPKLGSDELVATTDGKPILTTWGFGLGRVAAFTTDNGDPSAGDPSRPWASAVYSGENSRLISSMINWAIGDPRPTGGVVIQAEDIWGGTPGKVIVTSNTLPQVKLDGAPVDLSRTGPTTYETSINLEKAGFHDLSGYGIAVNYPLEYRDVGFNDQLESVINANGGRVYDESEVEGLLLLDIKEKAVRTVQEPMSQKEPFLLAALGLFLTEVIVRRLKDYRKERPVIEENPPRGAPVAEPAAAE